MSMGFGGGRAMVHGAGAKPERSKAAGATIRRLGGRLRPERLRLVLAVVGWQALQQEECLINLGAMLLPIFQRNQLLTARGLRILPLPPISNRPMHKT